MVLAALPDLKDRLLAPQMFPLWRRITARVTLAGLVREEVHAFVAHVLGKDATARFTPEALAAIFEQARAVPAIVKTFAATCLKVRAQGPITAEDVAKALDGEEDRE